MSDKDPATLTAFSGTKTGAEKLHVEVSGNSRGIDIATLVGWDLVGSWVYSTNVTEVDFTSGLGFNEIRVFVNGVVLGTTGIRALRVSIDGGSNYLSSSGDYQQIADAGTISNLTSIPFHITNATAARYGEITIRSFNKTALKTAERINGTANLYLIPTANALNAIRIFPTGGGNLTAGSIYVFGR